MKKCSHCIQNNSRTVRHPLRSILASRIRERCEFDVTHFEEDKYGYKAIVSLIDTFSKHLWAMAMKDETTEQISEWLKKISQDQPWEIYQCDNGKNLNSKVSFLNF